MEIIKRWLKDRVGLEVHPQLIDAQFANGYRLGQVLNSNLPCLQAQCVWMSVMCTIGTN